MVVGGAIPTGKMLDMGGVMLCKMLISPDVAAKMLKHRNESNRLIAKNTVKAYVADIRAGLWDSDAVVPIVFDRNGILRDGHHRLNAIVLANVPAECWVVYGAEPSNTYDLGKGRSINDKLKTDGIAVSNNETALIRAIGLFMYNVSKVSVGEIKKAYETDGKTLRLICNIAMRGKASGICRKTPISTAMYIAYKTGYATENQLIDFAEIVNTGIPKEIDQVAPIVFRNQILTQRSAFYATATGRKSCFRIAQEALSYFIEGKSRKQAFTGKRVYEKAFMDNFRNGSLFDTGEECMTT